jgi:hypothetical protein
MRLPNVERTFLDGHGLDHLIERAKARDRVQRRVAERTELRAQQLGRTAVAETLGSPRPAGRVDRKTRCPSV